MMSNMNDKILLSHELLSAVRAHKIFYSLMNFLVIEKRCNEPVALTANVANIKICFFHVLSHVNLQKYY